jgi:ferric-dicitrate binding protein FerR (iron transport regulator)
MTALARSHVCDGRDLACLGCAAVARRHELVRTAMTEDDQLDDLTRVRIWNALEPQLAAPRAPRRIPRLAVGFGAFAVAAVAVVVLVLALRDDPARTLTVSEGATLSSPIGPHTRAGLVGPAIVDVVRTGPATSIRLRRGTFVADFEGGPDRSLRIAAPGAVIEVVGTLFAVEARATSSCVSVAHGTVRVTTRSSPQVTLVTTGQTFCSDSGARPIAPAIELLLARHEQTLTADAVVRPRNDIGSPADAPARPDVTAPPVVTAPPADVATPRVASRTDGVVSRPTISSPRVSSSPPIPPRVWSTPSSSTPPTSTPPSSSPNASTSPSSSPRVSSAPPISTPPRTSPATPSPATPPPPQTAPPPATPPPIARPTADELYRAAERALANRDTTGADRALEQLITDYPTSPLGEQALYERARLAHQKRAWASARRHLDRLLALPQPRLVEPARYLVCRIAVEAGDGEATSCLVGYRKAYPRSPHDVDVLGLLIEREHERGGCAAAAWHIDELARLHPRSELARAWRARCEAR